MVHRATPPKKLKYLQHQGFYQRIPIDRAQRHIKACRDAGMSAEQVANLSGLSKSTVSQVLQGARRIRRNGVVVTEPLKGIYRDTEAAILRVPILPPPDAPRCGSEIDKTGAVRRLQALACRGFPISWVSMEVYGNARSAFHLMSQANHIKGANFLRLCQVYDKLWMADPVDHGITEAGAAYVRLHAKRKGWAPPGAWDEETLDDPDAHPEWTGACGTREGFELHAQYEIPVCVRCTEAKEVSDRNRINGRRGGRPRVADETLREKLVEFLALHPGASTRQIKDGIRHNHKSVMRTLSRMRDAGEVRVTEQKVADRGQFKTFRHYLVTEEEQ